MSALGFGIIVGITPCKIIIEPRSTGCIVRLKSGIRSHRGGGSVGVGRLVSEDVLARKTEENGTTDTESEGNAYQHQ